MLAISPTPQHQYLSGIEWRSGRLFEFSHPSDISQLLLDLEIREHVSRVPENSQYLSRFLTVARSQ